jgi:hypothetical protein
MLTHVETALVYDVTVESWGSDGSRALVFGRPADIGAPGAVYVVVQTPEDCDQVIRAAAEAKRQMTPAAPCTAVRQFGGRFAYCDAEGGHGEHRAPGLNEGDPDLTWTDAKEDIALTAWQRELADEIRHITIGDGPVQP